MKEIIFSAYTNERAVEVNHKTKTVRVIKVKSVNIDEMVNREIENIVKNYESRNFKAI